jgi:UDP-N-acetylmuramoylalanine--D-glutamate ligase
VGEDVKPEAGLPVPEPVAVLGVGVEGRATIDYLLRHGVADVTALDRQPVEGLPDGVRTRFGQEYDRGLDRFATVFRSPGVRPDHPELLRAASAGARITSALSCFLERCPTPFVVGVTGTLGKGTAASLTAALLEAGGFTVHLGGNIGRSPLEFLDEVRADHRVVLEISSFQAMDISRSPRVGVILKTTSEHLDWHRDTAEYRAAKASLLTHQDPGDTVVYNAESPGSVAIASHSRGRRLGFALDGPVEEGLHLSGDGFWLRQDGAQRRLPLDIRAVRLPGRFNLENIAAAILAAVAAGADASEICSAAETFSGLPHRLETVCQACGIRFVNDSYATRPDATLAALASFTDEPLAIVLGGSEKNADFAPLAAAISGHPTLVYVGLIGATAARLERAIRKSAPPRFALEHHDGLASAVQGAARALTDRGVVLLSPACASFGLFPNYKVRGERFRARATEAAGELSRRRPV